VTCTFGGEDAGYIHDILLDLAVVSSLDFSEEKPTSIME
jgi:hypothetical protein